MKDLTLEQITALQETYGVTDTQNGINSGDIWKFEGSVGRMAMDLLEAGVCMLPEEPTHDYYGNTLPPRTILEKGSKGSFENSVAFWTKVNDGDFETIDQLESIFGTTEYGEN